MCCLRRQVGVLALLFHKDAEHTGYSDSKVPNTGNVEWTFDAGLTITSSPVVEYGMVYFGCHDGNVYAVNAMTGSLEWKFTTGGYVYHSLAVWGNKVYVASHDRNLYALDAVTGEVIWSFLAPAPIDTSIPTVVDGVVYICLWDGTYAIDANTGELLWKSEKGFRFFSPAVAEGKVIVVTRKIVSEVEVNALNKDSGEIIWTATMTGATRGTATISNNRVFVACEGDYYGVRTNKIYAFDLSDGDKLWEATIGTWDYPNYFSSSLSAAYGMIYFLSGLDGKVYALDEQTGSIEWSTYINHVGSSSSPAIADGKVFIGSSDGKVYCLDAYTGDVIWSYATGGRVHSSPAIAYGRVYVGSNDGKLYCFGSRQPPGSINLSVTSVDSHSITLSWDAYYELDFLCYELYMAEEPLTTSVAISEKTPVRKIYDPLVTSCKIVDLWSSTTYYFVMKVVVSSGLSSTSASVSATTLEGQVIDNATHLIVPEKVKYTLGGYHKYTHIQIHGILYVEKYDGSPDTGVLELEAPFITIFEGGAIIADGAGSQGGDGGGRWPSF